MVGEIALGAGAGGAGLGAIATGVGEFIAGTTLATVSAGAAIGVSAFAAGQGVYDQFVNPDGVVYDEDGQAVRYTRSTQFGAWLTGSELTPIKDFAHVPLKADPDKKIELIQLQTQLKTTTDQDKRFKLLTKFFATSEGKELLKAHNLPGSVDELVKQIQEQLNSGKPPEEIFKHYLGTTSSDDEGEYPEIIPSGSPVSSNSGDEPQVNTGGKPPKKPPKEPFDLKKLLVVGVLSAILHNGAKLAYMNYQDNQAIKKLVEQDYKNVGLSQPKDVQFAHSSLPDLVRYNPEKSHTTIFVDNGRVDQRQQPAERVSEYERERFKANVYQQLTKNDPKGSYISTYKQPSCKLDVAALIKYWHVSQKLEPNLKKEVPSLKSFFSETDSFYKKCQKEINESAKKGYPLETPENFVKRVYPAQ